MATRVPAGLIDFDAFLRGAQGAQQINLANQKQAVQDIASDFQIRNMLQDDNDRRVAREAGTYLSTLPINRLSAAAPNNGMSEADHLIAQRDAIMNDPFFQENSPEFQQQVLKTLTDSAKVKMQDLNRTGAIDEVAKLANSFGQVPSVSDATAAVASGDLNASVDAINRTFGTQFAVDAQGNVQVGNLSVPAQIALPAAAQRGFVGALEAAMKYDQEQRGLATQSRNEQIEQATMAAQLQRLGVDPTSLGLPNVSGVASPAAPAQPTSPLTTPTTGNAGMDALDNWIRQQQGGPALTVPAVPERAGVSPNSVATPTTAQTPVNQPAAQPNVAVPAANPVEDWRTLLSSDVPTPNSPQAVQQIESQVGRLSTALSGARISKDELQNSLAAIGDSIATARRDRSLSGAQRNQLIGQLRQRQRALQSEFNRTDNLEKQTSSKLTALTDALKVGQAFVTATQR